MMTLETAEAEIRVLKRELVEIRSLVLKKPDIVQFDFNTMIGTLDQILSQMIGFAAKDRLVHPENIQTLKHHAEDMIGAGNKILELLKVKKDG